MGLKMGPHFGISPPSSPIPLLAGDSVNRAVSPGLPVTARKETYRQVAITVAGTGWDYGPTHFVIVFDFD